MIFAKCYGRRMAWFLFGTCYATMVAARYFVELVFTPLHLTPTGKRHASVVETVITWSHTTMLNIASWFSPKFWSGGSSPPAAGRCSR